MRRNLAIVTPPTEEPVSLELAKLHCNAIDEDADLVALYLQSAREVCEAYTRRTFITTVYEARYDCFPNQGFNWYALTNLDRPNDFGVIQLPNPPLVSVASIKYFDEAGTDTTLDSALYEVDAGGKLAGTITPAWQTAFPWSRPVLSSVRIQFTAGYGDPTDVPSCAKAAILLLTGHLYRNREAVTEGSMSELPMGVKNLLRPLQWGHYA